jgi:hypothetical protein
LVREAESSQLNLQVGESEEALAQLHGSSITYRIALGPQRRAHEIPWICAIRHASLCANVPSECGSHFAK